MFLIDQTQLPLTRRQPQHDHPQSSQGPEHRNRRAPTMQILTQEERLLRADPLAVATARELAALIPNETVILFGSRARGDHRPDSDIDTFLLDHQATAQSRVNELHETA